MLKFSVALLFFSVAFSAQAEEQKTISLFGSKPVQLSVGKDGIQKKDGGYICDLEASLSGAKYSDWGETEEDARNIVHKKCADQSGLLICKKDKAVCRVDK